jgi:pyruvate/2-oxoglutarate dehydrogenase complex dihydrolipoamide dehydrogenase (E3) component
MIENKGVAVLSGTEMATELVRAEKPDVVVIVTGAFPALPEAEGLGAALTSSFAATIDDGLQRRALPQGVVVVYGAGEGIELARDLAQQGLAARSVATVQDH